MSKVILQAKHLGFGWEGKPIFADLNLSLNAGECLGIAGASGVGKSLLLRCLAALEAFSGELLFQQRPLSDLEIPVYRSQVIYLAQQAVFQPGSVQANLDLPFRWGCYRDRKPPTVDFEELGLPLDFGERQVETLSGGERQKTALLRALRLEPQVLLLDEPTAAMDPASTLQVEALLSAWRQRDAHGLIWVSHQAEQLQRVSQLILTMGTVVGRSQPERFRGSP